MCDAVSDNCCCIHSQTGLSLSPPPSSPLSPLSLSLPLRSVSTSPLSLTLSLTVPEFTPCHGHYTLSTHRGGLALKPITRGSESMCSFVFFYLNILNRRMLVWPIDVEVFCSNLSSETCNSFPRLSSFKHAQIYHGLLSSSQITNTTLNTCVVESIKMPCDRR